MQKMTGKEVAVFLDVDPAIVRRLKLDGKARRRVQGHRAGQHSPSPVLFCQATRRTFEIAAKGRLSRAIRAASARATSRPEIADQCAAMTSARCFSSFGAQRVLEPLSLACSCGPAWPGVTEPLFVVSAAAAGAFGASWGFSARCSGPKVASMSFRRPWRSSAVKLWRLRLALMASCLGAVGRRSAGVLRLNSESALTPISSC